MAVGSMRRNKIFFASMLFMLGWLGGVAAPTLHADPLALTGELAYQHASAGVSQFNQDYTADYNNHVDLTQVMALDTTLRYNLRSDAQSTRQNWVPSLSYLINNDLFLFNLSGTADEQVDQGQGGKSNRSLGANWNSAWQKQLWLPAVTTNFNRYWQDDSSLTHPQEAAATSSGANLDWDLALAKVFYSANTHENRDQLSGDRSKNQVQLTRIETDASFWHGLGTVFLSQQYGAVDSQYGSQVIGGIALMPVSVAAYHGETVPDPATLSANAALTDGDKETTAVTVINPIHPMNIGIRINFSQADRVYLYTDIVLSAATSAQFSWALYSSNNNVDWQLEQASLSGPYNPVLQRFEFVIAGQTKEFLKLVAVNDPAITAVNFTEIEVFRAVNATGSFLEQQDTQTTNQTNANLSLQLRSDLQLTSSVSYLRNNYTMGADMTTTDVTSGLAWNPNPDWSVRLNGNRNSRDRGQSFADETRSYGVSIGFPTLPTVDSMVGVTLMQLYQQNRLVTNGMNYTLQLIADLYADLNARFNFTLNQNDEQLPEAAGQSTSSQLLLSARFVPGLVVDWSTTYGTSSVQDSTIDSGVRLNWRLTERLSVQGGVDGSWGETNVQDVSCGFDLALTDTMQLSLTQRREISPEASNITTFDWRWTINRYLFMMTSGAFLYGGPEDEWNFSSRLSTRLLHL